MDVIDINKYFLINLLLIVAMFIVGIAELEKVILLY